MASMTDTTTQPPTAKRRTSIGELYSPQELADVLGVSRSTVYQWRVHGTGPKAIRVGKHTRYRASEVVAWLDANSI